MMTEIVNPVMMLMTYSIQVASHFKTAYIHGEKKLISVQIIDDNFSICRPIWSISEVNTLSVFLITYLVFNVVCDHNRQLCGRQYHSWFTSQLLGLQTVLFCLFTWLVLAFLTSVLEQFSDMATMNRKTFSFLHQGLLTKSIEIIRRRLEIQFNADIQITCVFYRVKSDINVN